MILCQSFRQVKCTYYHSEIVVDRLLSVSRDQLRRLLQQCFSLMHGAYLLHTSPRLVPHGRGKYKQGQLPPIVVETNVFHIHHNANTVPATIFQTVSVVTSRIPRLGQHLEANLISCASWQDRMHSPPHPGEAVPCDGRGATLDNDSCHCI